MHNTIRILCATRFKIRAAKGGLVPVSRHPDEIFKSIPCQGNWVQIPKKPNLWRKRRSLRQIGTEQATGRQAGRHSIIPVRFRLEQGTPAFARADASGLYTHTGLVGSHSDFRYSTSCCRSRSEKAGPITPFPAVSENSWPVFRLPGNDVSR